MANQDEIRDAITDAMRVERERADADRKRRAEKRNRILIPLGVVIVLLVVGWIVVDQTWGRRQRSEQRVHELQEEIHRTFNP